MAASSLSAHEDHGHQGPTYEVTAPAVFTVDQRRLALDVIDAGTGKPTAARFSLTVDGHEYTPAALGAHGLRFTSIHQGRKLRFVACYARGTGTVELLLSAEARRGVVTVAKGFEYLPVQVPFEPSGDTTTVTARLTRWSDVRQRGWMPAEEHLHYDRLDPSHDDDWLTMLAGDDLVHAHFLVLKGGNLSDVWARQYAYGEAGEASDSERLIRPGEEYRDGFQGHINLLGVREIIEPISTGGIGGLEPAFHYPAFYDVLRRARQLDGLSGPAHGTALGRSPTGIADAVLGAVDFWEIANTHLYEIKVWYQLMNCGYMIPPAAGTDLPNYAYREPWQPLLGETRMYVRVGRERTFEAWKRAVRRGEVFVTSGPLIDLRVNGQAPGSTVTLPPDGGEIHLETELAASQPLTALEVVQNGDVVPMKVTTAQEGAIWRWRIDGPVRIDRSCWIAARGTGVPKRALETHTSIRQSTMAHTAAIRILVGNQPIAVEADARALVSRLKEQREFYRRNGKYEQSSHRDRALELFDAAITALERQSPPVSTP